MNTLRSKYDSSIKLGEYFDSETGFYYLRARYYSPGTGRFISEDSYLGKDNDPLSLNLYTYCHNDPLNFWDPTGHEIEKYLRELISVKQQYNSSNDKASLQNRADSLRDKIRYSFEYMEDMNGARGLVNEYNLLDSGAGTITQVQYVHDEIISNANSIARQKDFANDVMVTVLTGFGGAGKAIVGKALSAGKAVASIADDAIEATGNGFIKINLQLFGGKSTVKEILKSKKGSIKNAPLGKGAPSWDEVLDMRMDEISKNAQKGVPGYKTIKKLLTDKRFDR